MTIAVDETAAETAVDMATEGAPASGETSVPGNDQLEQLYGELIGKIPSALEQFATKPLARFQWRSRAASGASGSLDVILDKVIRSKKANASNLVLEFRCVTRSGSALPVQITLNLFRQVKAGTINYRTTLGGNVRNWELAAFDEGELRVQTELSRPQGLAAVEHCGAVWFGDQRDAAKHGVATGVERVGTPIVNTLVSAYWPQFNVSAPKRRWTLGRAPALRTDGVVAIEPAEWAAGILAFCLWSMLLRTLSEPDERIAFDGVTSEETAGSPRRTTTGLAAPST